MKSYLEFISELKKVPFHISGSGYTKQQDIVYDDEPTSAKSPSSRVLLRQQLARDEFLSDIDAIGTEMDEYTIKKFKYLMTRDKLSKISPNKRNKMIVSINNLRFLEEEKKELGEIYCEYCDKGPLVVYGFHRNFRKVDGATADHKHPKSKHQHLKFDYDNLAVSCYSCNMKKADLEWVEWVEVMKNNPMKYKGVLNPINQKELV